MLDAFQPGPGHAACGDQPAHPLAVYGREAARRPARREALGVAIRVDRLEEAVDPAVAQCLVHGVVVRDARLAALLFVVDEPDLGSGAVVLGKPPAPFAAILGIESLADVHPSVLSPAAPRRSPRPRSRFPTRFSPRPRPRAPAPRPTRRAPPWRPWSASTRGWPPRRTTPPTRRSRPPAPPDRKSTRLNSSHLVISYAVFCLKKKKIVHD